MLNPVVKSLLLASLAVSFYACAKDPNHKPVLDQGALSSVSVALFDKRIQIGNFLIHFQGETAESFQLVINHNELSRNWRTSPGKAFLSAARTDWTMEEFAGAFIEKESNVQACREQTLSSVSHSSQAGQLLIEGQISCGSEQSDYRLFLIAKGEQRLQMQLYFDDPAINRSDIYFHHSSEDAVFGFGEQYDRFDFNGERVPVLVSEQGLSRGRQPLTFFLNFFANNAGGFWYNSYAPVPFFMSSTLQSLVVEDTAFSVFDFRPKSHFSVSVYDSSLNLSLLFADSPLAIITEYTGISGRMRALPDWIHDGAVLGIQGGTKKVEGIVDQLLAAGTELSAVWIQDWQGQRETFFGRRLWWNWELDEYRYPDFENFRHKLAEQGIRLMGYINPFLVDAALKGDYKRNLFQEAKQAGYLLHFESGAPVFISQGSFKAYMLDLTNPQAGQWIKAVIKDELLARGFSGWMADFGEAMPFNVHLHSGESGANFHNSYPVVWAKLNREAIEEVGQGDDAVFFMRSAFTKSPAYSTLFWLGDQSTTWDAHDGIKSSVTGLLSGGLSGFSFNHSDVGGYFSLNAPFALSPHRSPELLKRWIELGAFQTIMRTHEGLLPDKNAQVYSDPELIEYFARFTRVHKAWQFYRKTLINEAAEKGWPVLRHPFLHYPDEKNFWRLSHQQYLIGSELWFAPVLDPGQDAVSILLPQGNWIHAFSGKRYQSEGLAQAIEIPAPLGSPALLYREGSEVGKLFRENLQQLSVIETTP